MSETFVEMLGLSLMIPSSVHRPLKTAELIGEHLAERQSAIQNGLTLDMGCGCGILALQMAKLGAKAVIALDLNPNAVQATADNWQRNQLAANGLIASISDGFQSVAEAYRGKLDFIVSNPPVQPLKFSKAGLEHREKDFHWNEAGSDGRAILDLLMDEGIHWLRPQGHLLFSSSSRQGWKQTESKLNYLLVKQLISEWQIVYQEFQPLQGFQAEYLSFWLELQTEDDPHIFLNDDGYEHQFFLIEVIR